MKNKNVHFMNSLKFSRYAFIQCFLLFIHEYFAEIFLTYLFDQGKYVGLQLESEITDFRLEIVASSEMDLTLIDESSKVEYKHKCPLKV